MSGFGPPPGDVAAGDRVRRASYLPPGGLARQTGVLGRGQLGRYALPTTSRPGIIPLRPLGLAEVIDAAVKHERRNAAAVLGASALVQGLAQLPAVIGGLALLGGTRSVGGGLISSSWLLTLLGFAGVAVGVLVLTGLLAHPVAEACLGRRLTLRQILTAARPRGWRLVLAQALLAGIAVGPWLLVVVLVTAVQRQSVPLILSVGAASTIAALALNLLVLPRLVFVGPALTLERIGIRASVRRSWTLSKPRYGAILGAAATCAFVVAVVFGMLMGVQVALYLSAIDILEVPLSLKPAAEQLARTLATLGTSTILMPFLAGVTILQYLDARMRSEGLDLVLMRAAASRIEQVRG